MYFGLIIVSMFLGAKGVHDVRFAGDLFWAHGYQRVEVFLGGQWHTICSDTATNAPNVLCRMMFGSSYCNQYVWWYSYYTLSEFGPSIDTLTCTGSETSIHQCSYTILSSGNSCANNRYMAIYLYYWTYWVYRYMWNELPTVRLTDGPSPYNGRLELYFHDEWGTVCDDGFGRKEARVVCRMLGFENPIGFAYKGAFYGKGSGHIYFDDVNCDGWETNLFQCQLKGHEDWRCNHSEDVGVFCAEELTFALCVGAAVLMVLIVVITIVVVVIVRRCRRTNINCATAALDATKWDLLLVIDTKDALTHIAGQVIAALCIVEPKPKIKRTQVHRLHLQENPVRTERAIFFLCNFLTTDEQCCKYLFPKLALKTYTPKTIKVFSTDFDCTSFKELNVKREASNEFSVSPIDPIITKTYWQVPFIQMYFEPRLGNSCFYISTLVADENEIIKTFSDTLKGVLNELGIRGDVPGEKSSFRLVIKHTGDHVTPKQTSNKKVPDFIFVKRPRNLIHNEHNVRVFASDEVLNGIIFILSEMNLIKQKYVVKKKEPITKTV